jgi:hypothetical protein
MPNIKVSLHTFYQKPNHLQGISGHDRKTDMETFSQSGQEAEYDADILDSIPAGKDENDKLLTSGGKQLEGYVSVKEVLAGRGGYHGLKNPGRERF